MLKVSSLYDMQHNSEGVLFYLTFSSSNVEHISSNETNLADGGIE